MSTNFCPELVEQSAVVVLFWSFLRGKSGAASKVRGRENGSNLARLETAYDIKKNF